MIHPTATIHPKAVVDPTVKVGPYAVIDEAVVVGAGCVLGPYVYLTGCTRIGPRNKFFPGAVIGEAPQDLKYTGVPSLLEIGEGNVFREHVTVHRSNTGEAPTVIGNNNLLMAHCHVAHDCRVGTHVIIANGALLGGHVTVGDRALVSGNCLVHQFVRVGTMAMMQGGSAISKDLPPYTVARGDNGISGLNTVGLRRSGMSSEERLELKEVYHLLFRSKDPMAERLEKARKQFSSKPAKTMIEFVATSTKRGICADRND